MNRLYNLSATCLGFLAFLCISSVAAVPPQLSYQGRLLDSTGVPVADGPYLIQFRLYDAQITGNIVWNSGFRQIEISDGLFSYNLGDTTLIPNDLFANQTELWLGIKVGIAPELSPRIEITASAFAYQALRSDSALTLAGQEGAYYLDWNNLTNVPAGFADGVDDVGLITSGIASNREPGIVSLDTVSMTDLVTVTITTPADGYIRVDGQCNSFHAGTTGQNYAWYQIDETAGGTFETGFFTGGGLGSSVTARENQFSIFATRIYFKPAGTYTFRLEGQAFYINDPSGTIGAQSNIIVATFFPVSYGSVTTVAEQPGDHPTANAISITNPDGTISSAYTMDLRYYEEKARAARIAEQKAKLAQTEAELELARARQDKIDN